MNQMKSYLQLTKNIASKLQNIKKVNTLTKLSDNEYLTQVIISKKNIVENSSLDYQNLYKVNEQGFQLIHQGNIVQSNLYTSFSHDSNRFVKQQSYTEESEKPRQVIEVYESNKLLFSINTQKFHEEILNNEMVGEPFKWNSKNNKVLYLAKAKAREAKTFFQVEKEEELKHAWNYRKYEQSWGERMDNIDIVNLYMLDVENQKLFKIQTPPNLFLTYPQFLENDDIIIGGYQISKEFKYGIVHCFNRRSGIYLIEKPQVIELPEKNDVLEQEIQFQLLSKHDVSIKPSLSPDYKKLLYMGSEFKHQHLCYLSLNLINLENKQVEELIPIHYENYLNKVRNQEVERDNIFGGICGYYDDLQQTFWNKESSYFIFSSFVLGQQIIYGININNKQIENLSHKIKQNKTHNCLIVNYDHQNDILYYTDQNINQPPTLCALLNTSQQNRVQLTDQISYYATQSENLIEQSVYSGDAEGFVWYLNKSNDNVEIPTYFDKRPLIVIAHGGPHGHAFSAYTQLRHTLLEQGFIILAPNYSGSSSYGQKFIEKLSGNIGTLDVQEILDMVQQIKNQFNIGKVFILGGSYGGYLSAMMGSKHYDIFNAAVIMNPVVNLPFMINITDIPEWGSSCALNKEHTWNLSAEDYKILIEKSPMLQPLKIPSLLLIGAKDRRCPYQQSLALRAQALEAGTNVQTYVYPNADHSLADSLNTGYDTYFKTLLFLNEQI